MIEQLFIEINKFDQWAQSQYSIPQDAIGGEWECAYSAWDSIYNSFEAFLGKTHPEQWTDQDKDRILYIIARDNEIGRLVASLPEHGLIVLTKYAIENGHRDDKWQLATQLYRIADKNTAAALLEPLVNDEEEYVSRRAFAELPKINTNRVEYYAQLFWSRNKYGDMDEYQKMTVLYVLKEVNSNMLAQYLDLARKDGRQYLLNYAMELATG
jgi:hypothetical protein